MTKNVNSLYFIRAFASMMVLAVTIVHAAENDTLQVFASPGPDTYADGTPILPGEAYALVWARNGYEFAGFDVKGQLVDKVNNAFVAAAGLGANREGANGVEGYCPKTGFQVRAAWAAAHTDGSYALVLLDTRMGGADGKLRPSGGKSRVNGWGLVDNGSAPATSIATGSATLASVAAPAAGGTVASMKSALPADCEVPRPLITGIRVDGDEVELRVKGTTDLLLYNVSASESPAVPSRMGSAKGGAAQGRPNAEEEMTFRIPAEKGRFFKVIRN